MTTSEFEPRLLVQGCQSDSDFAAAVESTGFEAVRCASIAHVCDEAQHGDVAVVLQPGAEALTLLRESAQAGLAVVVALAPDRLSDVPVSAGFEVIALPAAASELSARVKRARLGAQAAEQARVVHERQVQQARFRTLHDQLTGLPNARSFRERLEGELLRAERDQEPVTVAVLRVGDARSRGEALGPQGPQLLREVAGRIRDAIRSTDTLAFGSGRPVTVSRGAAPEFLVLLPAGRGSADPQRAAERLLALARGEAANDGEPAAVLDLSVGYAVGPDDARDADELLAAARAALELARPGECRRTQPVSSEAQPASIDAFELWYQPIFDVGAGEVIAVEALLRWRHPSLGLLGAEEILDAARAEGVSGRLYGKILDGVCRQWREWVDAGVGAVEIGLNIDGPEWRSPRLGDRLAAALDAYQMDPSFLRLELNESDLASAAPAQDLLALGVRLCVHDFGREATSLATLRVLRDEQAKLARNVVAGVPESAEAMREASAVVAMCRAAGVDVVALGVESERQQKALAAIGYELMQGVGLRAPQEADQCAALMRGKLRASRHATILPFRRVAGA